MQVVLIILQTKYFVRHGCCVRFYLAQSLQVLCGK